MLRIIKIVTSKTYVQKALILNGFFLLAQPPGERERTIVLITSAYNYMAPSGAAQELAGSYRHGMLAC